MSNNLISYTSRDYLSIFQDLVDAIPQLSSTWTSKDETDPGIVILKLMSMFGDMLSYNQDKQALEVYPDSVQQRKNAAQIFGLIGYKMHWYKSATCVATVSSLISIVIPRYSTFVTKNNKISYTNLSEIDVSASSPIDINLIQGTPRLPPKISVEDPNSEWHDSYDYNLSVDLITDCRYYIDDADVDETSITLVDSAGEQWIQVDDISLQTSAGKYFEFDIDEYDKPYIKFVSYWTKYNLTNFKLFYIVSDGSNGTISAGTLASISSSIYDSSKTDTVSTDSISINNTASIGGYDPETPDEARITSKTYVNTFDTLITLSDFRNAVSRMAGVANCEVLDCTNDPTLTAPYTINIYIVRTDAYAENDSDSFKEEIKTALSSNKMITLDTNVELDSEGVSFYYWTVKGEIYTNEPVDSDKGLDIINKVNSTLKSVYSVSNVSFNTDIKFIDVMDTIKNTDSQIHYVDLQPIQYYQETNGELAQVDSSALTGKYTYTIPMNTPGSASSLVYSATLPNIPIKPSSVTIRLYGGSYILKDDGSGKISNTSDILQTSGTINYKTGVLSFTLNQEVASDITVTYKKNVIALAKYMNLNSIDFRIADDSVSATSVTSY
jgi:hypothetical protein